MSLGVLLPKVSVLKKDLTDGKSLLKNRDAIEKEKESLQHKIDSYGKVFPSQHEIPKLLESLSSIAAESGVRIIGIRPIAQKTKDLEKKAKAYQEIPIEIIARSGYHQLGRFLQKLETGDRFIIVKGIEIAANGLNIKKHNVKLVVSTFILVE